MLQPNKRKQLDTNIKSMLANGATQEDVLAYSSDFNSKFAVKKKRFYFTKSRIGFGSRSGDWFFGYTDTRYNG